MPRSINGWPVLDAPAWSDPRLVRVTVPGTTVRLLLRADAAPLLAALAADYHREVAPLRPGECWSYGYRAARAGHGAWSDHASGTAVDLNSAHEGAQGPRGGMATMSRQQVAACAALKRRYRVVVWGGDAARGGDYRRPANWDPMHYAIRPGTSVADVRRVCADLGVRADGARTGAPTPTPQQEDDVTLTDDDVDRIARRTAAVLLGTRLDRPATPEEGDTLTLGGMIAAIDRNAQDSKRLLQQPRPPG